MAPTYGIVNSTRRPCSKLPFSQQPSIFQPKNHHNNHNNRKKKEKISAKQGGRRGIQWRLTENDICSSAQSSRKLHHLLPIDEYHSDKSSSATLSLTQRSTADGPSFRPGGQPLGAANSNGRSPATKLSRECGQKQRAKASVCARCGYRATLARRVFNGDRVMICKVRAGCGTCPSSQRSSPPASHLFPRCFSATGLFCSTPTLGYLLFCPLCTF